MSPSATLEEAYLLQRITRHLGSDNIDYRLRQRDFRDQNSDPKAPLLGCSIADLDTRQGILVIGSNLRMEVPIVAHRVRKAARKGASVAFVNPDASTSTTSSRPPTCTAPADDVRRESRRRAGRGGRSAAGTSVPAHVDARRRRRARRPTRIEPRRQALARKPGLVLLGHIAQRHPHYADIRALAAGLAAVTGATLGYLSRRRELRRRRARGRDCRIAAPAATRVGRAGLRRAARCSSRPRNAYILFGIEPTKDLAERRASRSRRCAARPSSRFTAFVSDELLDVADVLLPIGTFAETAGTFVNARRPLAELRRRRGRRRRGAPRLARAARARQRARAAELRVPQARAT